MQDSTVMSPERWRRIQALFEQASALDPHELSAWLAHQCGEDEALRDDVAALLESSAASDLGFDREMDHAIAGTIRDLGALESGLQIGRYRIVRLLGRGGMGAVYLAERADQQFDQQVALKLIGSNLPGSALTRRFRAERQILAHLNHPNIARLLDGGATDAGMPYLAMEYVAGIRIDVYCEQRQLDIEQRLRLVQQVCAAVQYAHQNLIVHRDIKPSNILVTTDGTPKLLDFGIAKLLAPQQTGTVADLTRIHERVLTPEHASPEQVRGEPVGTVSDVYSLGVLLYELLTGERPYSTPGRSLEELEHLICNIQPLKPSAAISQGGRLPEQVRALSRTLAGDLDNIVMRAMHKEPQRRYPSAAALSDDITNYLDHHPVLARPDAWNYRVGKFVRRNRAATTAGAGVVLLIASLIAFYTVRLAAERDFAELEAAKSAQVAKFLTDIFQVADPSLAQGRQITAVELLDQGARDIDARLADQPLVRADLLSAIGISYKNLSEYEQAGALLEESLSIKSAAGLANTRDFALIVYELANLRRFQGRFDESEREFKRALAIQRQIFDGPHEDTAATLTHLAVLYYEMQRLEDSLRIQQQALEMTRAALGDNHAETADRMNNLALILQEFDRYAEAERYLRDCIRIQASVLGARHPNALITHYNLGLLLHATGRYQEAEALFRELLPIRRAVLGAAHPSVGYTLNAFGSVLTALGRFEESERALNEALQILTSKLGSSHWRTGTVLSQLGNLELARGDHVGAEQRLRAALEIDVVTFGDDSVNAHKTRTLLASSLMGQRQLAVATQLLERSHAALISTLGTSILDMRRAIEELGRVRVRQGRIEDAEDLFRQAVANYERVGGPHNPDAADARLALADIALAQGQAASAISFGERALADLRTQLPADHWRVAMAEVTLGRSLLALGRADAAAALINKGSETLGALLPQHDPRVTSADTAVQMLAAQADALADAS